MRRTSFCLVVLFWALLAAAPSFGSSPSPGDEKDAPRFDTVDLDGAPVRLEDLLGRSAAVVLNFWGLRCGSCIEEIPYLSGIAKKFGPSGVTVVGINSDGIDGPKIRELLPKTGVHPDYQIVVDPELQIMDRYGVTLTPCTVMIRANGKIAYVHVGFVPGDEKGLEAAVAKILDERRSGK